LQSLLKNQNEKKSQFFYFFTKFLYQNIIAVYQSGICGSVVLTNNFYLYNNKQKNFEVGSNSRVAANNDDDSNNSSKKLILVTLKYFKEAPLIRKIFLYSRPSKKIFINYLKLSKLVAKFPGSVFFCLLLS